MFVPAWIIFTVAPAALTVIFLAKFEPSGRFKARVPVPLAVTEPDPSELPVVLPSPNWSVPALIVVVPV